MSIWFFVWLGLSAALLYFLAWTLFILFRQKRAWRNYAHKMKLRYDPKHFIDTPEISGLIYGYTVGMFAGEHAATDTRGTRKLTAIEIHLSTRSPFEGAIASGGMVNIARSIGLKEETRPPDPEWNETWIATANEPHMLEAYLTPERVKALISLMKIKNAWVILIFRGDMALLRVDTPDPMDDPAKIDKMFKRLTDAARILEFKSGEDKSLKTAAARKPRKESTLKTTGDALENDIGLKLEEETPAPMPPVSPEEDPQA